MIAAARPATNSARRPAAASRCRRASPSRRTRAARRPPPRLAKICSFVTTGSTIASGSGTMNKRKPERESRAGAARARPSGTRPASDRADQREPSERGLGRDHAERVDRRARARGPRARLDAARSARARADLAGAPRPARPPGTRKPCWKYPRTPCAARARSRPGRTPPPWRSRSMISSLCVRTAAPAGGRGEFDPDRGTRKESRLAAGRVGVLSLGPMRTPNTDARIRFPAPSSPRPRPATSRRASS